MEIKNLYFHFTLFKHSKHLKVLLFIHLKEDFFTSCNLCDSMCAFLWAHHLYAFEPVHVSWPKSHVLSCVGRLLCICATVTVTFSTPLLLTRVWGGSNPWVFSGFQISVKDYPAISSLCLFDFLYRLKAILNQTSFIDETTQPPWSL